MSRTEANLAAARQLLVSGQGGFALPSARGRGGRHIGPCPLAQVLAGVIVVVVDVDVDVEVDDEVDDDVDDEVDDEDEVDVFQGSATAQGRCRRWSWDLRG